jgi:carnitine 3-dehydrogenase
MTERISKNITALVPPDAVRTVGLVGAGSVGCGWAAIYLARGYTVMVYDPARDAPEKTRSFIENCWSAVQELNGDEHGPPPFQRLEFTSLERVAAVSDILHENGPARLHVKRSIFSDLAKSTRPNAVICSSSGGLPPSDLQRDINGAWRIVIAHPFNPPHLIPLVEVLGGRDTAEDVVEWTVEFLSRLGKRPIRLRREMTAYLTNRLQFALLREAVHCLNEGVASARSIDDALTYGLGPRWAVMGSLMTLALAGGEGGMKQTIASFGAAMDKWWADLGSPRLTPEIESKLVEAAEALTSSRPISEWIHIRDAKLVKILRALSQDQDECRHLNSEIRGPRKS